MSDAVVAPVASPKKVAKKAAKPKKPADHPKYIEMITKAITELKERNGSSRQAIVKYVAANFKVGDGSATHIKMALKRGVTAGLLKQVKGAGASGSFKLAAKPAAPKKKPAEKKPAAAAAAKKPAAKKASAKKATPKKKPAAKKAAKTTPKKKTVKKVAAKKASAKKPVAKKVKKTPKKKAAPKKTAKK